MKRHLVLLAGLLLAGPATAAEASWIFAPSRFSHEAATGERVIQHSPPAAAYYRADPTYVQSGYHHSRTSFQFGDISDNLHVVETWGVPIRPYGEWLRPYRAGATPYGPWGNSMGPWTTPYGTIASPYGPRWLPNSPFGYANPGPAPLPDPGGQPQIPTPPQPQPPRPAETDTEAH